MISLRPYQQDAIDALYAYFGAHVGNPLVVLPTGAGKSVVIGKFVHDAICQYPDTRVLMITHVKELIAQNFAALLRIWPDAPAGVYSAGLNRRDLQSQVLFCGIQSVHKRALDIQRCDLALIDEAHLIPRDSGTMYRRFLNELTSINPWLKVIGFTATPYRLDSGMLHKGRDALFTDVAYEANLGEMVANGYLSPITAKQTSVALDVTGVHKRGGEFIASELEAAVNVDALNRGIVDEIVAKGESRGSWLIFCAGKAHATAICSLLRSRGVSAACIFGDTPQSERDRLIREFKSGQLRALINVNVLTTGFDAPGVDLIAMLRPTASTGLYVQMLGRGTRLAEGKDNCLVLDFAGNARRHGPADAVCPPDPGKGGDDEAPVKACPQCELILHAAKRQCPECGYEFPAPEIDLATKPDTAAVMVRDIEPEWIDVTGVDYALHTKPGSPPSLRVEYQCGISTHREWVCLEHSGYARQKAVGWWSRRAPGQPVPATASAALQIAPSLPVPSGIKVRQAGKYFDIVGVRF